MGVIKKIHTATFAIGLIGYTAAAGNSPLAYNVITDCSGLSMAVFKDIVTVPTHAIGIGIDNVSIKGVTILCTSEGYIMSHVLFPDGETITIVAGNFDATDTKAINMVDAMDVLYVTVKFTK